MAGNVSGFLCNKKYLSGPLGALKQTKKTYPGILNSIGLLFSQAVYVYYIIPVYSGNEQKISTFGYELKTVANIFYKHTPAVIIFN